MLPFEEARDAADHLRARSEVGRAPLAGFLTLLGASAAQALLAQPADLRWTVGILGWLVLAPWVINRILPARNLMGYRLALVAYPMNALLLAFVVYLQIEGWHLVPTEDFPVVAKLLPWSGLIAAGAYLVVQGPDWMRRVALYAGLVDVLKAPPAPGAVAELDLLLRETAQGEGAMFRSVPATPLNWSRFVKLDTQRHGYWKVAFSQRYALVAFEDGSQLEAVPKGGLKLVSDDVKPGEATAVCLVRWNKHLLEGRIAHEDFERISSWNTGVRAETD